MIICYFYSVGFVKQHSITFYFESKSEMKQEYIWFKKNIFMLCKQKCLYVLGLKVNKCLNLNI